MTRESNSDPNPMRASLADLRRALEELDGRLPIVRRLADAVAQTLRNGRKLLTCGNGGSAAEALHLSEELMGRFSKARRPLAALCLSSDPTAITCIANDYGYEQVFSRQVEALAAPGDALLVLTTSGNSLNILSALERARAMSVQTLGLLGPSHRPAEPLCDIALTLDALSSARIQELHLVCIHLLLERIDAEFA
ncbi:MAG: SIS domain-containing protein [Phycisphaerae bacterium]|nr:SIS domain-containing protein [Phycisphaerae bacterium]